MIISRGCRICRREVHILVPRGGYNLWARGLKPIQEAMPQVSEDDRELIVSGICGHCFDKMFKED